MILPRCGAGVRRHPAKASAAASTAARASSRVACRFVPMMSSVLAGLMLLTIFEEDDSSHLPPIKFLYVSIVFRGETISRSHRGIRYDPGDEFVGRDFGSIRL